MKVLCVNLHDLSLRLWSKFDPWDSAKCYSIVQHYQTTLFGAVMIVKMIFLTSSTIRFRWNFKVTSNLWLLLTTGRTNQVYFLRRLSRSRFSSETWQLQGRKQKIKIINSLCIVMLQMLPQRIKLDWTYQIPFLWSTVTDDIFFFSKTKVTSYYIVNSHMKYMSHTYSRSHISNWLSTGTGNRCLVWIRYIHYCRTL